MCCPSRLPVCHYTHSPSSDAHHPGQRTASKVRLRILPAPMDTRRLRCLSSIRLGSAAADADTCIPAVEYGGLLASDRLILGGQKDTRSRFTASHATPKCDASRKCGSLSHYVWQIMRLLLGVWTWETNFGCAVLCLTSQVSCRIEVPCCPPRLPTLTLAPKMPISPSRPPRQAGRHP